MKVLVTGASGYMGGRLCHALLHRGYSVRAFVRIASDISSLPPISDDIALEFAYGDVTDYPSLLAACSGCNVVFHAAAIVESWLPDPSKFISVNVGGLKNVLKAYKETDSVKKIIYTSSFFALGSTDGYTADESQDNMKVLVTGASGYMGGRLCHALLRRGYSVRAFVRIASDISSLPPISDDIALEFAYGDVTDYPSLLAACSGCNVVFHAAAIVESWLPDPSKFISVNVGGLNNVLKAYKETDSIKKIIYTSSFFALGSTDGYTADESQMHTTKSFCTEYERSKTIADEIALEAAKGGIPIVSVCPGVMYGPGKITAGNVVARMMIERFNGRLPGYIGDGYERFSFSHVDDVVDGHISALDKGKPGERYLLTGENASFMQVFDIAASITNTKRSWLNVPLIAIMLYGWLSVLFCLITGKLPLISPPAVSTLKHQWAYSCEKAKRELNYKPRSLTEGLKEVLPWLKKLGVIEY